jgi:hypothetical protein
MLPGRCALCADQCTQVADDQVSSRPQPVPWDVIFTSLHHPVSPVPMPTPPLGLSLFSVGLCPHKQGQVNELFHVGSLNQLDAPTVSPSTTAIGGGPGVGRPNFVRRTFQQASSMMHMRSREGGGAGGEDGLPTYCVATEDHGSGHCCTTNEGRNVL